MGGTGEQTFFFLVNERMVAATEKAAELGAGSGEVEVEDRTEVGGLSAGAVAGITLGVIGGFVIIAVLAAVVIDNRLRRKRRHEVPTKKTGLKPRIGVRGPVLAVEDAEEEEVGVESQEKGTLVTEKSTNTAAAPSSSVLSTDNTERRGASNAGRLDASPITTDNCPYNTSACPFPASSATVLSEGTQGQTPCIP